MQIDPQDITTRYLLGDLSDEEMIAFEARYFSEPEAFDAVQAAESDLIDAYVRRWLPGELRERFETRYLSDPARRERVRFAEALAERVTGPEPATGRRSWFESLLAAFGGRQPGLRSAMAVAGILIVIVGLWFFVTRDRPVEEIAQTTPANTIQDPNELNTAQVTPPPQSNEPEAPPAVADAPASPAPRPSSTPEARQAPRTVTLALSIGGVRGDSGRTPVLVIPRGTAEARLSVRITDTGYSSYRLSLQTVSGTEIASRSLSRASSSAVLTVPASKLADGDHVLTLTGVSDDKTADDIGRSLFRVRRGN